MFDLESLECLPPIAVSLSLCCCFHVTSSSSCDQICNYKRVKRRENDTKFHDWPLNGGPGIQSSKLYYLNLFIIFNLNYFIFLFVWWCQLKCGQVQHGTHCGRFRGEKSVIPEANPCTDRSANRSAGLLFAYVTLNSFQGFHGHAYLAFISDLRCVGRSQWREDGEVRTLPCYMITVPLRMKDYQRGGIFTVAPKRSDRQKSRRNSGMKYALINTH